MTNPKLKPATWQQRAALARAVRALKDARDDLAEADCPRALARVKAALTSAQGAQRHMERRFWVNYHPEADRG